MIVAFFFFDNFLHYAVMERTLAQAHTIEFQTLPHHDELIRTAGMVA